MGAMSQLGNDLYTGERSVPFVAKRKLWFALALVLVVGSILVLFIRPPQFSIEFTGGSQFTVSNATTADESVNAQGDAIAAVKSIVSDATTKVTTIAGTDIRVQTSLMSQEDTRAVATALAEAFNVNEQDHVTASFVGPSWGADVTKQSLWGLGVFLALAFLILAIYFRTMKMSIAAIIGLVDVLIITLGVYAAFGFEISPAAVIGFLTILGYSLYDTTVVFDKIRETTWEQGSASTRTFGESVNLGVNQTLIRSINTSIVAVLPVGAILVIGAFWMGAQTLSDISLSITVGIIVAAYSTLFVAAPLYSFLREGEDGIKQHDAKVLREREAD